MVLRERWQSEWALLLDELTDRLSETAKAPAACEVILLTHHEGRTR